MNIEIYFWALLIIIGMVVVGLFFAGFGIGAKFANKGAGVGVGVTILVIMAAIIGVAKSQELKIGPIVVYEAAWIASAFNFALVGGYIRGKNVDAGHKVTPAICVTIAVLSLFIMGIRLHELVNVLRQLGIGEARHAIVGPDTSIDCNKSLGKIYLGFVHYAEVNDALPPASKWIDEEDLFGTVQADEWFHCPTVSNRKDDKYGYAFNAGVAGRKLKGKKLAEMPDAAKTPLVFDTSTLAKNAHDPVSSLPHPGRHGGRNNILYCDGHIETVAPK